MNRSRNIVATPPGATIKEQLIDRGMSQKELAARMDMSEKHISRLIKGDVQLTSEVALRLEMVLGVPASFWNKLEAIYREKLTRVRAENLMDADIELARKLPYKEMSQNRWLPETRKIKERIINLRKFFGVAHLGLLSQDNLIPRVACRRLMLTEKGDYALIAWVQQARLEARKIETEALDLASLEALIPEIRAMTSLQPEVFQPKLSKLLADCGLAIVFLPHLGGSFLHGASFLDGKKMVIGLTVRGKDADRFWFSLFHEIAHILEGDTGKIEGLEKSDEDRADAFARQTLIPDQAFQDFVEARHFSRQAIIDFAQDQGIDPGIVLGRLQREAYVKYNQYQDLKTKYAIQD